MEPTKGYLVKWSPKDISVDYSPDQNKKFFEDPEDAELYADGLRDMGYDVNIVETSEATAGRPLAPTPAIDLSGLAWQPIRAGDLVAGIAGPAKARRRKAITYHVAVRSTRTGLVENAVGLSITVPAGVTVAGVGAECTRSNRSVTCALGSLDPWSTHEVTITVRSRSARTLSLAASVSGSLPELDVTNDSATKSAKVI